MIENLEGGGQLSEEEAWEGEGRQRNVCGEGGGAGANVFFGAEMPTKKIIAKRKSSKALFCNNFGQDGRHVKRDIHPVYRPKVVLGIAQYNLHRLWPENNDHSIQHDYRQRGIKTDGFQNGKFFECLNEAFW